MRMINADYKVHPYDSMMLFTVEETLKRYAGECPRPIEITYCNECEHADWQYPGDGLAYCHCKKNGSFGLTATDFCSRGRRAE